MRTMAKSSRCASMSEAIASRIEWQLHACATPQCPLCCHLLKNLGALPRPLLARHATMRRGMLRFITELEKSLQIIQS